MSLAGSPPKRGRKTAGDDLMERSSGSVALGSLAVPFRPLPVCGGLIPQTGSIPTSAHRKSENPGFVLRVGACKEHGCGDRRASGTAYQDSVEGTRMGKLGRAAAQSTRASYARTGQPDHVKTLEDDQKLQDLARSQRTDSAAGFKCDRQMGHGASAACVVCAFDAVRDWYGCALVDQLIWPRERGAARWTSWRRPPPQPPRCWCFRRWN
jgi:hypothetical protein